MPLTLILLRHGEKPDDPVAPPLGHGLTALGEQDDKHSLVVRGWQRAGAWAALFGPAGLPTEIATRQAEAIGEAMREPGLAARLADLGVEAKASTPAELDRFFRHELQATREIVRRARIDLE